MEGFERQQRPRYAPELFKEEKTQKYLEEIGQALHKQPDLLEPGTPTRLE